MKRIESGAIRPLVAETYPLDQIVDAQKSFVSKGHMGKIVLDIP
ncbi:zinc-binding dehydrogenase [Aliiroseovarius sp. S253]